MDNGARVAALGLIGFCGALLAILALGSAAGINDPPAGGGAVNADWTVTDARSYSGCTITLTGDLTISSTGKLDLSGVLLVMNCPSDGTYGIEVQNGGELILRNSSNITSSSPDSEYTFIVRAGGKLTATDSRIKECGYDWGTQGENAGLYILSDTTTLARTELSNCYYGAVVRGASPAFTDCIISSSSYGVGLLDSGATFIRCTFSSCINGANLEDSPATFLSCRYYFSTGFGLLAFRSSFTMSNCDFAFNTAGNLVAFDCNATVSSSIMRESCYGIYLSQGSPAITNCTLSSNRYGMYAYRSTASIEGCLFDLNIAYGVSAYFGTPVFSRCNFTRSGPDYDPVSPGYQGTGLYSYSSNAIISGGRFEYNGQDADVYYATTTFSNVSFQKSFAGLNAFCSEARVTDCNFSQHRYTALVYYYFSGGSVKNCNFVCETYGVGLVYQSPAEVSNCTFLSCKEGMGVAECGPGTLVQDCLFDRNSKGLTVWASTARIYRNKFVSNINFTFILDYSEADVRNNVFQSNTANAMTIVNSGSTVTENFFVSNLAAGIFIDTTFGYAGYADIYNNSFDNNAGSGVHSYGKKTAPQVHDNHFIRNGIAIALTAGSGGSYHHNNITFNNLVGISVTAAFGEFYCNTINGQTHGIACNYNAAPSVHHNRIFGNEGGIVCHVLANASIWANTITNNTKFGISVYNAYPDIVENTITGSLDGIRLNDIPGPESVFISQNRIEANSQGVRSENACAYLAGCNFTLNWDTGAYFSNSTVTISACSFYKNDGGACIFGGRCTVQETVFLLNNNSGIETEQTVLTVDSCLFQLNTDGILDIGNSSMTVIDGTYLQDVAYGFYCGPGTSAVWNIKKTSTAFDTRFFFAGNLTVTSGATLRFTNATLFMALDSPGEHYIEVHGGGRFEALSNSTIAAGESENKFSFRVLAGGNLSLIDSVLRDCGSSWGAAGEKGGLYLMSSNVDIRNCVIDNCSYGIIANGIQRTFSSVFFARCGRALAAVESVILLDNCTILVSGYYDLELQQSSRVVLMNTTFDRSKVAIIGPGNTLEVYWYLHVNAAWQNKVVVPMAGVYLEDAISNRSYAGSTDERGWLQWVPVLEFIQAVSGRDMRSPYNVSVSRNNVTTDTPVIFDQSVTLFVTLRDLIAPHIEILSPVRGARLNVTPVRSSGIASDNETGLERMEVSFDGRFWEYTSGNVNWSHSAKLNDGNYTLYARATDAVGNRAVVNVTFSLDTVITLLEVTSPAEGYLTRNPVLAVTGSTEAEARITVNGRDAPVVNGKFNLMAYLTEGNNTILVSAQDQSGNTMTITRRVVVDTVAPLIELVAPRNQSYVNTPQCTVTGRTEPGAVLLINGIQAPALDGRFSLSLPLAQGVNQISITAMDAAGNQNSTSVTVYLDTEAPILNILYPKDGYRTGKKNVTINGSVEPFSIISAGDFLSASGADGRFTLNVSLLHGNNTLVVKATDRAGNSNSLIWHVVRVKAAAVPAPSPWLPAILTVVVVLIVENFAIWWYYTKRRTPQGALPVQEAPLPRPRPVTPVKKAPDANALSWETDDGGKDELEMPQQVAHGKEDDLEEVEME